MIHTFSSRTRLALLALVLWLGLASQAMAAVVVNTILVNNGSTANVNPGDLVTISVTVTLSSGSRWRSTAITTSPGSSLSTCSLAPDISVSGTFTRTFQVYAPSTSGVFSVNVVAWTNPNCNGTASATKTLPGGINTGPVTLSLNHVRIQHDGSGLTCAPETITLKACANAACTTAFTDNVSINLATGAGTWSAANPVVISNGTRTLTLSNATAGTYTLGGTVTSPSATSTAAACYNGATNTCSFTFSNSSCSLDAVETGKAANTPIYTKRMGAAVTLDVLALTNGTINTSSTATIGAQLVQASGSGCSTTPLSSAVSVTLAATNAGRRSVTMTPSAASANARVRLTSGSLVGCSSDNFAIRPSAITVTATGPVADPTGASVTNLPTLKADTTAFTLAAATAVGYDGVPQIDVNMVEAHAGANAGGLSGAFSAAPASSGTASGAAFKYSETGYFRLNAYGVYDDDYTAVDSTKSPAECYSSSVLGTGTAAADPNVANAAGMIGCYFGSAQTAFFGRFIPDHFTVIPGTLVNRSTTAACSASTFSYLGEPMAATFTIEAQNGSGDPTTNYTGTFAKLIIPTQLNPAVINAPATGTRTAFAACGAHPCFTLGTPTGTFVDGVAEVTMPLTLTRPATAVAPYADLKIGVAASDGEVSTNGFDLDTNATASAANRVLVGSTIARYGRMSIDNAYGSELLGMGVKVAAQFWNGSAFATNTLDNCTPQAYTAFLAADYKGTLNLTNMPFTNLTAGAALVGGIGKFTLAKPIGALTGKGSVAVKSSYTYLPGYGRATFGLYKAGPVIFVRETY